MTHGFHNRPRFKRSTLFPSIQYSICSQCEVRVTVSGLVAHVRRKSDSLSTFGGARNNAEEGHFVYDSPTTLPDASNESGEA